MSHNYFQKSLITRISLTNNYLTRQPTHQNPFPTPRFLDMICYVPVRERPNIGAHPDKFFLARKRRITMKLDFRINRLYQGELRLASTEGEGRRENTVQIDLSECQRPRSRRASMRTPGQVKDVGLVSRGRASKFAHACSGRPHGEWRQVGKALTKTCRCRREPSGSGFL
jgi:hypothetical protein